PVRQVAGEGGQRLGGVRVLGYLGEECPDRPPVSSDQGEHRARRHRRAPRPGSEPRLRTPCARRLVRHEIQFRDLYRPDAEEPRYLALRLAPRTPPTGHAPTPLWLPSVVKPRAVGQGRRSRPALFSVRAA